MVDFLKTLVGIGALVLWLYIADKMTGISRRRRAAKIKRRL